jgi:uncharacterized protein with PIN domain
MSEKDNGSEAPSHRCAGCNRALQGAARHRAVRVDNDESRREVAVCFGCRHRIEVEGHWRVGEGPESFVLTSAEPGCCGD